MKKISKVACLFLSLMLLIFTFPACSIIDDLIKEESPQPVSFTVNYYDGKTKAYTPEKDDKSIQTDFIAPTGKVIKGLFDENDVQYAGYDCVVDLKNNGTMPSILYAEYENVDISYLNEDPFAALDENPRQIGYYSGFNLTWKFDVNDNPDDEKMIAACLCNPYANIRITVSFMGKGQGSKGGNEFISKLLVCGEEVSVYKEDDLEHLYGDGGYVKHEYCGIIKAKQLTNADYEFTIKTGAKLGYADYTIKNYKIEFAFDFNS